MIKLQLVGVMAERYGPEYEVDAKSPREAVQALCSLVDGFMEYVRHHDFNMWVDEKNIGEDGVGYNYGNCTVKLGLHVTGAGGSNGLWMVIAGIALIVVAWWNPGAWGASAQMIAYGIGGGIAAAGAAQLLMPVTNPTMMDEEGNKASYGFNKPVSTVAQGNNVPVLYGKGLIGGFVIMYRITTDDTPS